MTAGKSGGKSGRRIANTELTMSSMQATFERQVCRFVFFFPGGYYTSRARAEPAFAPPRSRARTTHWWPTWALFEHKNPLANKRTAGDEMRPCFYEGWQVPSYWLMGINYKASSRH
jgi:hypothetical protein